MCSCLDGVSGYNQVSTRKLDQSKTIFTTDWGTYAFSRMSFRLCNMCTSYFSKANDCYFLGLPLRFPGDFYRFFLCFHWREGPFGEIEKDICKVWESQLVLTP